MVALAQFYDVILKKSGRLFQMLMDIISQSWVIEKAFCLSAKVLRDSTDFDKQSGNDSKAADGVQAECKAKHDVTSEV